MSRRHPARPAINENGRRNTRPIKWARELVSKELDYLLSRVRCDESILFIGEVIAERGYSVQRISEWQKRFAEYDQIPEATEKIKTILEARIVKGALTGKYRSGPARFHLINNFGWRSRVSAPLYLR